MQRSLFSIAPIFSLLLCARFMSGLPRDAFFGVGAVVATQLAEPGKGASAVAILVLWCFMVPFWQQHHSIN